MRAPQKSSQGEFVPTRQNVAPQGQEDQALWVPERAIREVEKKLLWENFFNKNKHIMQIFAFNRSSEDTTPSFGSQQRITPPPPTASREICEYVLH